MSFLSYSVHVKVQTVFSNELVFAFNNDLNSKVKVKDIRGSLDQYVSDSETETRVLLYGYLPVRKEKSSLHTDISDVNENAFEISIERTVMGLNTKVGCLAFKGEQRIRINQTIHNVPIKTRGQVVWKGNEFEELRFTSSGMIDWRQGVLDSIQAFIRSEGDHIMDGYKLKEHNSDFSTFQITLNTSAQGYLIMNTSNQMDMSLVFTSV